LSFNEHLLVRHAFEKSISILGKRSARDLFEDLGHSGVDLSSFTLENLSDGPKILLGEEATEIVLEDVIVKLDELCSLPKGNDQA
jgi:hypothetical protein